MKNYSKNEVMKFQLALRMAGVDIHPAICETMLLVRKQYIKKGGDFTLKKACKIMAGIQKKYPNGEMYQSIKIGENFKLL